MDTAKLRDLEHIKLRVIIPPPFIISVPRDNNLVRLCEYLVSLETFSLKLINSNNYLFISISVFWALLIWICISEFDWLRDSPKLVFQLAKQKPDPEVWWFLQGNSPLLKIDWSRWIFLTHLKYDHTYLLEVNSSHWCFKLSQMG